MKAMLGGLPLKVIECGCCGHYHWPEFFGDCRDDANRFTAGQLDDLYGEDGWEVIEGDDND